MATTTNYGWTTPDDTALVKDGASAIRTLGSSVDTTTKNLNPETTLGDIAYRSSTANVKTRLGLGTAGQVLQVNSGATAPEWATFSANSMTSIYTGSFTGATVTLSSVPSTYQSLVIFMNNTYSSGGDVFRIRFNSDSGTNYITNVIGSSITATINNTFVAASSGQASGDNNEFVYLAIPNYAGTTNFKMVDGYALKNDGNSSGIQRLLSGWVNAAAITSIQFSLPSGTFTQGTYAVFGVK